MTSTNTASGITACNAVHWRFTNYVHYCNTKYI